MFPMIGSFHGPGGMFGDDSVFLRFLPIFSATMMKREKDMITANMLCTSESMIQKRILVAVYCFLLVSAAAVAVNFTIRFLWFILFS